MTIHKIVLVGAGNIGKRTLQALLKLDAPVEIIVVEPNAAAREAAQAAAGEIDGGLERHTVGFHPDMQGLPAACDLAIVATSSKPRYAVLDALFERSRPAHLVLEKFLFQERGDYDRARALIETAGAKCWVSCPRPAWPGYQWLAQQIAGRRGNLMLVSGGGWNMASNAVHMLDCFARVSGEDVISVDGNGLDPEVLQNKRAGYLELSGRIMAEGANGGRVLLQCDREPGLPLTVDWFSPVGRFRINEGRQEVMAETADTGWKPASQAFPALMASELTPVYRDILQRGECDLTAYGASAKLHLALIDVFNEVFYPHAEKEMPCPVT